jgi:hypothetical protein
MSEISCWLITENEININEKIIKRLVVLCLTSLDFCISTCWNTGHYSTFKKQDTVITLQHVNGVQLLVFIFKNEDQQYSYSSFELANFNE